MNSFSPERLKKLASSAEHENRLLFKKLKRLSSDKVDLLFREAHDSEFESFDCLTCANCCKSISPMMSHRDVDRMAKGLGIKPSALVEQHLTIDSDGDYVFRSAPCPFLLSDNKCLIYEHRPKACREYPHTDRKRIQQIFNITLKNIALCPIVFGVIERIKKQV
ncbi:MAG: zinc/iron-chelating domain-containing protein [Bacteroidetes bacterium HGW-Bacteroidetes-15]|nr:MAG: zinc/iron-chelating domain-containing protein [Bacteroidetes bacterium HGW-Bacteroidetes-15]